MRKLTITLLLITSILLAGKARSFRKRSFHFDSENVFGITTVFNSDLESRFAMKLMLNKNKRLYLYIYSPGGSVSALTYMTALMDKYKPTTRFICIARGAYSAAFMLFQNCDERYMLEDGILMNHNPSVRLQGELPRIIKTLTVLRRITRRAEEKTASNMGISYSQYRKKVENELWYDSEQAKKDKIIEGIATSVTCSEKLIKNIVSETRNRCGLFGCSEVTIKRSMCPLFE